MFNINWWDKIAKIVVTSVLVGVVGLNLASCGDRSAVTQTLARSISPAQTAGNIAEVSPPEVIQQLRKTLEVYQPQLEILSPQAEEVFQDTTVTARFQVQDLPIFKNSELGLGPHLHVIVDNQPYIPVYDLNQPLVLADLSPGTHTLRVFASRPWHESFKNEGAYAQTKFHVYTKTEDNSPNPALPLLTYSRPQASYGAEPILLDFYLTNAPVNLATSENSDDSAANWRIRCTINGNSFVIDRWDSIYLKGFKPGKNWVQLEFLDSKGNLVKNVFNNTVRLITYEPKGKDTLSKLVRGELSATQARGIVDPNYTEQIRETTPSPIDSPTPTLLPSPPPTSQDLDADQAVEPEVETQEPKQILKTAPEELENQKPRGFFNRFRRPNDMRSPTLPEVTPTPSLTPDLPNLTTPEAEKIPAAEPQPEVKADELNQSSESNSIEPKQSEIQKPSGFFNRLRRPTATPSPIPPTLPEIVEPPLLEHSENQDLGRPPKQELHTRV